MNRSTALLLILALIPVSIAGKQTSPPPQTPSPGKIIIQTPFGPKEVDIPATQAPAQPRPETPPPAAAPVPTAPETPPTNPAAQPAPQQPAAAPPQPPSPPQTPADQDAGFRLQGEGMDIYAVVNIFAGYLRINYIIDPAVRGSVTINAAANLRRADLMPILEMILKSVGATIIQNGNFYLIVPSTAAPRQPLHVQDGTQLPPAPDDQMVMQIIRMKYASATEMATLLGPYSGEGATITAHETGNILLITERRSNLRKLLEIVDIFDTNVFEGERVRLFPVKNNLAKDLVTDLQNVFSGYALSKTSGAIKFTVLERMNSILVIAPNPSAFPEVEKWLARLDDPATVSGRRTFVYKVKNSKAEDLGKILIQLYSGLQTSTIYGIPSGGTVGTPGQLPAGTTPPPAAAAPPPQPAPAPNPFGANPPAQAGTSAAAVPGTVRIIPDTVNNALVVQATQQEYADVLKTIQELDVLPRQVLIDAQVYEVTLDDSMQFGITATLQTRGTLGSTPPTTGSFTGTPPSLAVQTFAFVDRARELVLFLNAQENRSRVRTLSAPSVLVSDNVEASFTVGTDVPIPTTTSALPVQSQGTTQFSQTVEFRSTGVLLAVKPQINDSGNVTLQISQEISQAGANTVSAVVAPVIGKSSVRSSVVVQDSQTIALGGFIRENNELARARIPVLGRIPIAGGLFGNTRRASGRSELIILITPHVIRTHQDADQATDELKVRLREIKKLLP